MTPYKKHNCPVTKRLAEDMLIRNMPPRTIDASTDHARRFAGFIQKPLDEATVEDGRNFQLYLIHEKKIGYSSFNQAARAC
ncbi:phage integrase N-terminal SAM-like domain-containing protein [Rhodopirellula islandica]|nr:phage integrase N-terminal SAM-like domain-containing protein [Rhodopirellula islandica]